MIIVVRCIQIGLRSGNTMSMLVCFGVAATVVFQTFENVGMCIGIAPVVGITLPFFSYGGSSPLFNVRRYGTGLRYKIPTKTYKGFPIWEIAEPEPYNIKGAGSTSLRFLYLFTDCPMQNHWCSQNFHKSCPFSI